MKKLNQKELKALIVDTIDRVNEKIESYNKELPESDEYKRTEKEIRKGKHYKQILELDTKLCRLINQNSTYTHEPEKAGKYLSNKLKELHPAKNRIRYWSNDKELVEATITLANATVPFPYESIEEFRTDMINEIYESR